MGMQLIALILATWRLTEIVTSEQIFDPIRRRWPLYFWTCSRCVSVWAAILTVAAYHYFPAFNDVLAVSELFILRVTAIELLMRRWDVSAVPANVKGQIVIELDQAENINLKRCDFQADAAVQVMSRVLVALTAKNGERP